MGYLSIMQPRIRFVIPYFGRWPFWMSFFLRSCGSNPDIEWLFFTDCGVPADAPANVEFRECSFDEYCRQVSARLDIDFRPASPYKLCDVKPALGYIHADELDRVDYWAFGDIDVIYGQLRPYLETVNLTRFELLSTHANRISGHLCLMRNTARMREAFMCVPEWRDKLADPQHCVFDESAFSRLFIRHKNWPLPLRRLYDAANPWRRRSEFVEAFTTPNGRVPWVDGSLDFPARWIWRNGRLTNDRDGERAFPYFHFIAWKTGVWPAYPAEQLLPDPELAQRDAWSITREGFREV